MGELLLERARQDERICAITAAMPEGCGLGPFIREFPRRCFDVGIAEQHAATMAAGMAAAGLRPVFAVYSSFAQRAYDQILHDICLQNLPVVLLISHSGLVGADGETHHGIFDHSYLRQMPGMQVLVPAAIDRMGAALDKALDTNGPTAICYPKGILPQTLGTPADNTTGWQLLGQSKPCRGALLAVGTMTRIALHAADLLSREGAVVNVVDCMAIKPLDTQTLNDLMKQHQFLFTLEDNILQGGFGSAVLEYQSAQDGSDGTIVRCFGFDDCFIGHGPVDRLLDDAGLSPEGIKDRVLEIMGKDPLR